VDGQGLQTLYCTTSNHGNLLAEWSPDQQSIAIFNDTTDNATSNPNEIRTVQLVSTTTGQVQNIFTSTLTVQSAIGFNSWADNTHIYMYGIEAGARQNIYLLDVTKGSNQHERNLTTIVKGPFNDLASDQSKLYVDYNGCDQYSCSPPSTVIAMPMAGGASQTIWQSKQYTVTQACPLNDHQLLVSIANIQQHPGPPDTSHNGIWIMNGAGSLAQRLTTTNLSPGSISRCSIPGAHGSRDGALYALAIHTQPASSGQLIFGKLDGSTPTSFVTDGNGLFADVVGWTTT
jgi:hypothetical protein